MPMWLSYHLEMFLAAACTVAVWMMLMHVVQCSAALGAIRSCGG